MAAVCAEPEFVLNEKLGRSSGRGAFRAAGRLCAENLCVLHLPPLFVRVRESECNNSFAHAPVGVCQGIATNSGCHFVPSLNGKQSFPEEVQRGLEVPHTQLTEVAIVPTSSM